MTQTALEIDGLVAPFWAETWRHSVMSHREESALHDLLLTCRYGEDYGEHYVAAIGDSQGDLWRRDFLDWEPTERAPWPEPYAQLDSAL